ncbi:hypothetical protein BH10BAC5_BH10BAC5_25610 [soil metagenome]
MKINFRVIRGCIFLIVLFLPIICFSQIYHFEVKHSKNDIDKQRELIKNARVKKVIDHGKYFDEEMIFDKDGKITYDESYQSGSKEESDGSNKYKYNKKGQLIKISYSGGEASLPSEFTYDENGNIKYAKYDTYTENCFYDEHNSLIKIQIDNSAYEGQGCPINIFLYDQNRNLIKADWECCQGSKNVFNYEYDLSGNLVKINQESIDCSTGKISLKTLMIYSYNELNLPVSIDYSYSDNEKWTEYISYEYF